MLKENADKMYLLGYSMGCIHHAAIMHKYPDNILGACFIAATAPAKYMHEKFGEEKFNETFSKEIQAFNNMLSEHPAADEIAATVMSKGTVWDRMAGVPDVYAGLKKLIA